MRLYRKILYHLQMKWVFYFSRGLFFCPNSREALMKMGLIESLWISSIPISVSPWLHVRFIHQ